MPQGYNALRPVVLALALLLATTCTATVRPAEFVTFDLSDAGYNPPADGQGCPVTASPAIERNFSAVPTTRNARRQTYLH